MNGRRPIGLTVSPFTTCHEARSKRQLMPGCDSVHLRGCAMKPIGYRAPSHHVCMQAYRYQTVDTHQRKLWPVGRVDL
jgi:hypothetical protein